MKDSVKVRYSDGLALDQTLQANFQIKLCNLKEPIYHFFHKSKGNSCNHELLRIRTHKIKTELSTALLVRLKVCSVILSCLACDISNSLEAGQGKNTA